MSSDPFANTTTVKNILQHVLSPKIVSNGSGGYVTKTDLVNIDTVNARSVVATSNINALNLFGTTVTASSSLVANNATIGNDLTVIRDITARDITSSRNLYAAALTATETIRGSFTSQCGFVTDAPITTANNSGVTVAVPGLSPSGIVLVTMTAPSPVENWIINITPYSGYFVVTFYAASMNASFNWFIAKF